MDSVITTQDALEVEQILVDEACRCRLSMIEADQWTADDQQLFVALNRYRSTMAPPRFTCPRCIRTTHHPEDVRQGYCPGCHDWTGGW